MLKALRRAIIGKPLESARLAHERLSVPKGLAILSSDALSSVAYAGEEILHVLVPIIGLMAFDFLTPLAAAIAVLLFIVAFSFRQIINAYPKSSGGAYIVAKENLGVNAGLIAGAALLFDYLLTVAVSVSAGVAAITSAYQALLPHKVAVALVIIACLVVINLRGVTESANLFSYPTYMFIIGMYTLITWGLIKIFILKTPISVPQVEVMANPDLTGFMLIWVILRAFSSGCTALTGIEAVSDAVPNFKEPEGKNAKRVLSLLVVLLLTLFVGLAIISTKFHIVPSESRTVISQVALTVFGHGFLFYIFQASTGLILILAANTAFAGFPLLASLMAKDGYLPRYLALRGDKLVFSNGIVILGVLASILIIIFEGIVTRLIPLYAVGVFTAFTLAQSGMVKRWTTLKGPGWMKKVAVNGTGAIVTGVVLIVISATKFTHGAWVVLVLMPALVYLFRSVNKHYQEIKLELDFDNYRHKDVKHHIIVPVASLTNIVANAIDYGKTLSDKIEAIHISADPIATEKLEKKWAAWNPGVPLVVLESPYRSLFDPLVDYILEADINKGADEVITVLIPEFVTYKWWHRFLHNQTGLMLQNLLVFRSDVIVTTVPYHLHF